MLYGFVFMHLNKLIMIALLEYLVVIFHLKHLFKMDVGMLLNGRNLLKKT